MTDFNYEDLLLTGLVTCDLIVTVNDGRESSTVKRLRVVVNDVNEQQTGFRETLYYIVADEGQVYRLVDHHGLLNPSVIKQINKTKEILHSLELVETEENRIPLKMSYFSDICNNGFSRQNNCIFFNV